MKRFYEKFILPYFLTCACSSKATKIQRQKIVPKSQGTVLEIGFGAGLNLLFYDQSKVIKLFALDPSKELILMAKKRIKKYKFKFDIEIMESKAENIPLPDNKIDTVLVTYTMCTIPDIYKANSEIKRVIKPSGKLLFCEHGLSTEKKVAKLQNKINPIWSEIAGGCQLNRNIPELIRSSGFEIIDLHQVYLPGIPKFGGYNYWGIAVPNKN